MQESLTKMLYIFCFRFFGNRFRIRGNLNSPFDLLLQTFASRPMVVEMLKVFNYGTLCKIY